MDAVEYDALSLKVKFFSSCSYSAYPLSYRPLPARNALEYKRGIPTP